MCSSINYVVVGFDVSPMTTNGSMPATFYEAPEGQSMRIRQSDRAGQRHRRI
jgi:hypothetical protein